MIFKSMYKREGRREKIMRRRKLLNLGKEKESVQSNKEPTLDLLRYVGHDANFSLRFFLLLIGQSNRNHSVHFGADYLLIQVLSVTANQNLMF